MDRVFTFTIGMVFGVLLISYLVKDLPREVLVTQYADDHIKYLNELSDYKNSCEIVTTYDNKIFSALNAIITDYEGKLTDTSYMDDRKQDIENLYKERAVYTDRL
jgi:hypothetical protein